jgi:two-component system, OmpR family, response regulator TrcR
MAPARHVLVIEDDRITALVISEFLTANGYRTTVASNGVEGVARFVGDRPDLVLCDVLLPRQNGFDAVHAMRAQADRPVPFVMMSAFYRSYRQAIEQVPELDVEGFLVKPFDLDTLLERVAELLPPGT